MFEIVKGKLPPNLKHKAIERAVISFIKEIPVKGEEAGFYAQTIMAIHNAVYGGGADFWLAVGEDGEVDGYMLGHVAKEIDNKLTYWLSQAWANPRVRGKETKAWWQQIRQKAKDYLCSHIVVVSGRDNNEAYCRFLGTGYSVYATLLKEDI